MQSVLWPLYWKETLSLNCLIRFRVLSICLPSFHLVESCVEGELPWRPSIQDLAHLIRDGRTIGTVAYCQAEAT